MYNRIVGSSSQSTSASQAEEWGEAGDSPRFAEAVAGMEPGGSSSETAARYSLVSEPPIKEIKTRDGFMKEVKRFLADDIRHIAEHPEEYSDFVSEKAERAATVAGSYVNTYDDPDKPAKFYRYKLGDETVGLLRVGGPARIKDDSGRFKEQFGRNDITSVVDLRVTHPLVENAGDILLEHQLRQDRDRPLVLSRPAVEEVEPRLAEMGFVHMGRNYWVLDPKQHPEVWEKNENNEWQRVGKPTKYLSKAEGSGIDSEGSDSEGTFETDSSDDNASYYLERALRKGLRMD
ncbi:host specificity protein [Bradyrhizobium huanghuaihaiense]|uniref:host specificity protein n=1 Tax=Bradyrhizobium huanghuaihaiense TaxID=990078 RepID=UPI0021AA88C7|nr:host specificity protein [Bradyrhizobium sp. CB3035]UWU76122.1 host specificity protein [Bradyrhizobium sp. CB3035]